MSKRSDLEPLLIPDDDRFVVLPVKYQDLYQMYKSAVACSGLPKKWIYQKI